MRNKTIQQTLQRLLEEAEPGPSVTVRNNLKQIEALRNAGVTWRDIANALDCSPGALRTAYHRHRRAGHLAAHREATTSAPTQPTREAPHSPPISRRSSSISATPTPPARAGIVATIGDDAARNLDLDVFFNHQQEKTR